MDIEDGFDLDEPWPVESDVEEVIPEMPRAPLKAVPRVVANMALIMENRKHRPVELDRVCPLCGTHIPAIFKPTPPLGKWQPGTLCSSTSCKEQRALFAQTEEGRAMHFGLIVPPPKRDVAFEAACYTYGSWLGPSYVNDDFVRAMMQHTRANYNPQRGDATAYTAFNEFLKVSFGFLTIEGPFGIGKTYLEALACNEDLSTYIQNPHRRKRPLFALLTDFESAYQEAVANKTAHLIVNRAIEAETLVLSDIGQVALGNYEFRRGEDTVLESAPALRKVLFTIFEKRYQSKNKKTIISVNKNKQEDLNRALGPGAAARLNYGQIISMNGLDQRRREYRNDVQAQRNKH